MKKLTVWITSICALTVLFGIGFLIGQALNRRQGLRENDTGVAETTISVTNKTAENTSASTTEAGAFSKPIILEEGKLTDKTFWKYSSDATIIFSGEGILCSDDESKALAEDLINRLQAEKLVVEDGITGFGENAFVHCDSIQELKMADSVISIGNGAFADCVNLGDISFSKNLTSIGEGAFFRCRGIKSISFPESLRYLGEIFGSCTGLETVIIPKSVAAIETTFFECWSLKNFIVSEDNHVFSSENGILYNKDQTKLVRCPGAVKGTFAVKSGVVTIAHDAFAYTSELESVNIPSSVLEIESNAFYISSVQNIYYEGSKAEWETIIPSENSDEDSLKNAKIYFYKTETETLEWQEYPENVVGIWSTLEDEPVDGTIEYHTCYVCFFADGSAMRYGYRNLDVGTWKADDMLETITADFYENYYYYPGDGWGEREQLGDVLFSYDAVIDTMHSYGNFFDENDDSTEWYRADWTKAYSICAEQITDLEDAMSPKWRTQFDMNQGSAVIANRWAGLEQLCIERLNRVLDPTNYDLFLDDEEVWRNARDAALDTVKKQYEGGSMQGMMVSSKITELCAERVDELLGMMRKADEAIDVTTYIDTQEWKTQYETLLQQMIDEGYTLNSVWIGDVDGDGVPMIALSDRYVAYKTPDIIINYKDGRLVVKDDLVAEHDVANSGTSTITKAWFCEGTNQLALRSLGNTTGLFHLNSQTIFDISELGTYSIISQNQGIELPEWYETRITELRNAQGDNFDFREFTQYFEEALDMELYSVVGDNARLINYSEVMHEFGTIADDDFNAVLCKVIDYINQQLGLNLQV